MELAGDLARRFERVLSRLFVELGYHVIGEAEIRARDRSTRADFLIDRGQEFRTVEVKWQDTPRISLSRLRDIAGRVATQLSGTAALGTVTIALSAEVTPEHAEWISSEFKIAIWDRNALRTMAHGHPAEGELEQLLSASDQLGAHYRDRIRRRPRPPEVDAEVDIQSDFQGRPDESGELSARLGLVARGKSGAKDYEKVCLDIISYLFSDHLLDARPQNHTEDGLNILDIVYRVSPLHPFWQTLTRDFRTRVIVFECKNYTDPIGAAQVYTTERYLSLGGLRTICFLLTREAPAESALLAAYGAMRESGKLFVFLSDTDLLQMLKLRSAQLRSTAGSSRYLEDDPTAVLDQRIYEFLATMGR